MWKAIRVWLLLGPLLVLGWLGQGYADESTEGVRGGDGPVDVIPADPSGGQPGTVEADMSNRNVLNNALSNGNGPGAMTSVGPGAAKSLLPFPNGSFKPPPPPREGSPPVYPIRPTRPIQLDGDDGYYNPPPGNDGPGPIFDYDWPNTDGTYPKKPPVKPRPTNNEPLKPDDVT